MNIQEFQDITLKMLIDIIILFIMWFIQLIVFMVYIFKIYRKIEQIKYNKYIIETLIKGNKELTEKIKK